MQPGGVPVKRTRQIAAALSIGLLSLLSSVTAVAHHGDVRIGVLLEGDTDAALAYWRPIIAALDEALPARHIELINLSHASVSGVVERAEVDFVITDPGVFVALEVEHGVTGIATRVQNRGNAQVSLAGATIIARADHTPPLLAMTDFEGQRLIAMDPHSFNGWLLASSALQRDGLDPRSQLKSLTFANHDPLRIVAALRSGQSDVGVLPAGSLEAMIGAGQVANGEFVVAGSRHVTPFPFIHSTMLYPEWAFARLRYTPDSLTREVVVQLLQLSVEADDGKFRIEWTTPSNYQPVHGLLRELGVRPYEGLDFLAVRQVLQENRGWVLALVVALVLMLVVTLTMVNANRRLKQSRKQLSEENRVRRQAETALVKHGEELEERIRSRTAEFEYLAHYDHLTGLPNRNLMYDRLDELVQGGNMEATSFALMLVGFDNIAEINNSLGRNYGDLLQQQVGDLIQNVFGRDTFVARNGDETFVVLLPGGDTESALAHALTLHEALDRTFDLGGQPMLLKGQIGISVYPEHGTDGEILLRHADIAMHYAHRTKSEIALYNSSLNEHGLRDLRLLGDLHAALNSDDQLSLLYQPKVDLRERRLVGVEALLRWNHPQLGNISPEVFIPLAERTGLIRAVTLWVLNAVFDQSRRWQAMDLPIVASINLSAWNLQDRHLLDQIRELIDAWDVDPSLIEMEITEGAMMHNPDHVLGILHTLKDLGFRLSIDDFGTGFSSLSYLKRFPVNEVKIDKSFILNIASDEDDLAIVKATVELTHSLGMSVIAEGVGDARTIEILTELGCDSAQGFYIGHPLTANDLLKWNVETAWGQALHQRTGRQRAHPGAQSVG